MIDELFNGLIDSLIKNSGIKKKIGSEFRNRLREEYPRDNIEGAIINVFFDIDAHIMDADMPDQPIVGFIPKTNKLADSYKSLDTAEYLKGCDKVREAIDSFIRYNKEDEEEFLSDIRGELSDLESKLGRHKMKVRDGDTLKSFLSRYSKIYDELSLQSQDTMESFFELVTDMRSFISRVKEDHSFANQSLSYAKSMTQELYKNLQMISQIKGRSDIKLPEKEVDENIIRLLEGQINRSRLLKILSEKPKERTIVDMPKETNNNSTTINKEYVPRLYDKRTLEFLLGYGISTSKAKEIIDFHDIEITRDFINALENTFKNYGIQKELKVLTRNNPEVLTLKNGDKLKYIESLEHLYDLINPTNASGILPSFNTEIYSSTEKINSFINSITEKKNNVKILPSEKFSREKDYKNFTVLLESNPYAGSRMQKWVSKGFKKVKTAMYKKYSSEFGEGLFFKMDFGGRRSVYKLNNDSQGNYIIQVCTYFDLHPHYTNFYKNNK